MIADSITQKIGEAMKARDEVKLSTLRMLSSALNYEFIAKQHKLTEEEELGVVRHEAKIRKDAIEALTQAQGKTTSSSSEELLKKLEREKQELLILEAYLPQQMSDADLEKLVVEAITQTGATGMADMGKVIGQVMGKTKGLADGSRVSSLVKAKLNG